MTATGPNSVEAAGPSSSGSMLVFNQVRPDVGGAHWGGYDLQKEPFLFFPIVDNRASHWPGPEPPGSLCVLIHQPMSPLSSH